VAGDGTPTFGERMKARYVEGDLIGLPVRHSSGAGWDNGKMTPAIVTEVREWEDENSFNDPPITWDYLVLTSDGQEIRFDHEDFLCYGSKLLEN